MITDASTIEKGSVLRSKICIIGAGAAGITIARELMNSGIDVIVLEGGGLRHDQKSRSLYEGETVGVPYELDTTRTRFLGGSTNCWGGFCALVDPEKMEPRAWFPEGEWPFPAAELYKYYDQAYEATGIDPKGFTLEAAKQAVNGRMEAIPLVSDRIETVVAQVSRKRRRFGKFYRNTLKTATNVKVVLNANVMLIDADPAGTSIRRVKACRDVGHEFWVEADYFVLAAGGIENVRLLLSSNNVFQNGLGNQNDLVGRYFAEHAAIIGGTLELAPNAPSTRLYDTAYAFNKLPTSLFFQLKTATQFEEKVGHASGIIDNWAVGEDARSVAALKYLFMELRQGKMPKDVFSHVYKMIADIGGLTKFLGFYLFGMDRFISERRLVIMLEQSPNPDSRVMLGDQVDRLGMRRVKLDWRFTDLDRHTIRRTVEVLAEEMRKGGSVRLNPDPAALNGEWTEGKTHPVGWVWHHMGTTRMGTDPAKSVVDPNLKMHGMANFFVAGSSTFPSAPCHTPTISIVALSFRLAEHLRGLVASTPSVSTASTSAQRGRDTATAAVA